MFCGPETVGVPRRSRVKHPLSRVHKTYCFPEFLVNKYFIIYQESKKRKSKTNFMRKYMKYFINFLKTLNSIMYTVSFTKHSRFSDVQRSRVLVMVHVVIHQ